MPANTRGLRSRAASFARSKAASRFQPTLELFQPTAMTSQTTRTGQTTVFPIQVRGKEYRPSKGGWKTNRDGMKRLVDAQRLMGIGNTLRYVRFLDDLNRPG